jgi:hypothetical protein
MASSSLAALFTVPSAAPGQQQLHPRLPQRPSFCGSALLVIASFGKDLSLIHDCQTRTLANPYHHPRSQVFITGYVLYEPPHTPTSVQPALSSSWPTPERSKKRIEESIDGTRNENDIEKHCLLETNGRKASTVVNGGYIRRRRLRAADGATRASNFPAVGAKRGVAVAVAKRHGSNEQRILKQGFFNITPLDVVGRNRPGQCVVAGAELRQFCQRSPFGRQ